ncbi:873_t:CDS:2, partial [Entrophospora sp. SA101]
LVTVEAKSLEDKTRALEDKTHALEERYSQSTQKYRYQKSTDYTDNQAYSRRLSVRKAHLDNALKLKEQGIVVAGGGKMVGSLIIYEAESEEFVRNLVKVDPYVIGKVWEKYEIWPFKMALKS